MSLAPFARMLSSPRFLLKVSLALFCIGVTSIPAMLLLQRFWAVIPFVCFVLGGVAGFAGLAPAPIRPEGSTVWKLTCAAYLNLVSFVVMLLVPVVWLVIGSSHSAATGSNVRRIVAAMHDHADNHERRLPPAALRNRDGKPLLSWRVLILPYLGEDDLYQQFHLDEPWDSPHNIALAAQMPKVYRPVFPDSLPAGMTRWQVFIGPGTPFEILAGPKMLDDFPDGTFNTVLVAEAREAVPWTKPVDMAYVPDAPLPELGPPRCYHQYGPGLIALCTADGAARYIRINGPRGDQVLRWMIVRNDGKGWVEDR